MKNQYDRLQKKYRRIVFPLLRGLFIAIATAILAIACYSQPLEPLRVSAGIWPGFEPFYLARELGYYDDKLINMVETTYIQEELRAFFEGEIDMLCGPIDIAIEFLEAEPDIGVFLITDISHGGDVLLVQPEINSITDLKGKKVAMQPAPLGKVIASLALETVDLSLEDVELVSLELPDQQKAFAAKEVDAIVTYSPVKEDLLGIGAKLLFDSTDIPGEIVDLLIGRKSLVDTHPQQLQMLLEGWFKAIDEFKRNPEESMKFMAKREGVSLEQFQQSMKGLKLGEIEVNRELFEQPNSNTINRMKKMATHLKKIGIVKKEIDPSLLLEGRPFQNLKLD